MTQIMLFSGNANPELAKAVAANLEIPLGKAHVDKFSDGETRVQVGENVRGADVYVVQSTSHPTNNHVMELLIMVDALKRASAGSITAVIPYYGYARQDRKVAPRTPITAKLVADLLQAAGVNRVVAVELHAGQIQGFFNIPFDNLYTTPILKQYLQENYGIMRKHVVTVSPDAGGVERARALSKRLGSSLAIIDKRRERANESEVMNIIGEVKDRYCLVFDDMIDTAGTLANAANALMSAGALGVAAVATHAVLSGPAIARISAAPLLEVIVSDTIPLSEAAKASGKFQVVSVAGLLAEAVRRIHNNDSVNSLFEEP